ncbi:MAG: AI-2E family transporter [Oscillospiraceae bacterium]|nr:AI-2E family transporter [Oscillospiraceae bacterium]
MEQNRKNIFILLFGAMGCIVLYWLLHETERIRALLGWGVELLMPFLVGACLSFILNVPMRAIERGLKKQTSLKNTRLAAILLTLMLILLVLSLVFYLLIPQIRQTVETISSQLPRFIERVEGQYQMFQAEHPEIMKWLWENTDFEKMNWRSLFQQMLDLAGSSLSSIFGSAVSAVGSVFSGIWTIIVSLVFCFYCLGNKEQLARQGRRLLYAFLPEAWADEVIRVFRLTNSTFSNFLAGQCIEVCILGCMFALSMTLFRMPYVPLVSVLVAVTAFVPIVGAWIGCVFGAFFILVNNPMQAVWFVVLFLVLQQIENSLIYPRVVGTSVGLPSMWVLVSVTIGGELMGVAGMVLMIPVVSVIYTLLREFTGNQVTRKNIAAHKLKDQPPELKSKLKEKREASKRRREAKKAAELAELMKQKLHIPERHQEKKE